MPQPRVELHDWWLKGIVPRYLDINLKYAAFICGIWWSLERCRQHIYICASSICEVCRYTRLLVRLYVRELLCDPACSVARHGVAEWVLQRWSVFRWWKRNRWLCTVVDMQQVEGDCEGIYMTGLGMWFDSITISSFAWSWVNSGLYFRLDSVSRCNT